MRHLHRRSAVLAAAVLLLATGCSSSPSSGSGTSTSSAPSASAGSTTAQDTVVIKNFAFSPAALTVAPGTKVTVVNQDSVAHTVTSTASPAAFDTGSVAAGATVTFTAPTKAGSYPYICSIHTYMHGTLTVS